VTIRIAFAGEHYRLGRRGAIIEILSHSRPNTVADRHAIDK
jgi:hypothetical protein